MAREGARSGPSSSRLEWGRRRSPLFPPDFELFVFMINPQFQEVGAARCAARTPPRGVPTNIRSPPFKGGFWDWSKVKLRGSRRKRRNSVAHRNVSGFDDLGQYALSPISHQLAQSRRDQIHFVTGSARLIKIKECAAQFYFLANEGEQIDAGSFNVRPHRAGRDFPQTQRPRVFGDLFAPDQADLAAARLAATVLVAELPAIAHDASPGLGKNFADGVQRLAGDRRMKMERNNLANRHAASLDHSPLAVEFRISIMRRCSI